MSHYRHCSALHFSLHFYQTALFAMLIAASLLCGGCQTATPSDDSPSPVAFHSTPDTPTLLPPTPALFVASPPRLQSVAQAALPPRPPNADQVAHLALAAPPAKSVVATASSSPAAVPAGLIVCDPIADSSPLSAFGSGCGRWLDLVAAGQPELSQTPFWEARERAQRELGRTDFCLAPAQTVALATITGATHAACGTLHGTPAHCTLAYTLYQLPSGKPVGAPLTHSGSEAQVVAALPGMSKILDTRLGVAAPRVPASAGLSPAEMAQCEALSRQGFLFAADLSALARLSARSPVAGMALLNSHATDDQVLLTGMVKTLLAQLPGNALVLAHIGYEEPEALRPYAAATQTLMARYPSSALLAHTAVWQQRVWGTRAGEWTAAAKAARFTPADPNSWLSVSYTLSNIAEDLRQDRLAGDISAADWTTLRALYDRQEAADLRATALDIRDGHAWLRLAQSATFAGDTVRADSAIKKALVLSADNPTSEDNREAYTWGLQMYQPKWGGSPADLSHIAPLAAAVPWDTSNAATTIAEDLRGAGFAAQADDVVSRFVTQQRARTAKAPSEAALHWELAGALRAQGTSPALREASLEYRVATHLMPNAPAIHYWLGDVLDQRHRTAEAIAEYRQATALNPFDARAHTALGYDLKHEHQFAEAQSELRLALRLSPRNANAHYALGDLLNMQGHYKPAAAEYREAIRMAYYSLGAWISLPSALDQCGLYDQSLAAGQEADRLLTEQEQTNAETELPVHTVMADDYLHKKQWNNSIAESQIALSYSPSDAYGHANLAEAYAGLGNTAKAHAEWKKTLTLGNPAMTAVARKKLATNP